MDLAGWWLKSLIPDLSGAFPASYVLLPVMMRNIKLVMWKNSSLERTICFHIVWVFSNLYGTEIYYYTQF